MKELQQIEKQLSNLPDGKINCVHNGKFVKWFHSDGHTQTYIPKSQREYAQKLALKRFLLEKQKECKKESKAYSWRKQKVGTISFKRFRLSGITSAILSISHIGSRHMEQCLLS